MLKSHTSPSHRAPKDMQVETYTEKTVFWVMVGAPLVANITY